MPALTVLVAARPAAEDTLAVLGDYAAAGLLYTHAWVDAADAGRAGLPATLVGDGRADPVALSRLLTERRYDRVRIAVLVPVDAPPAARVPLAAEQAVEHTVRSAAAGAPVTLLRLLLPGGHTADADPALVCEGWHNLLVAPEDSARPGLGAPPADRRSDPLALARHVTPVIAAVTGLWAGLPTTPFDTLEVLPGQTVRPVRAYYRGLDATAAEATVRARLFAADGSLPLPHGGLTPVVCVDDPAAAGQAMARALWTKHRDVLRGPRVPAAPAAAQSISIRSALVMFLRFLAAALRRAPSAWISAALGSVGTAAAHAVQSTVFGRADSAFAVVTDPAVTGWAELGRSADALAAALPAPGGAQQTRPDLAPLWTDYAQAALTLADGGRRAAGLDPVPAGSGVAVVAHSADVVPGPADRFSAIPASLAVVIGVDTVDAADVLAAAALRDRLARAGADPAAGMEAQTAAADLDRWTARHSRSYAWQAAAILADFLHRARGEAAGLVEQIRAAASADPADERLRRRGATIALILRTLGWGIAAALVILAGTAALTPVGADFALTTAAALLGCYLLAAGALFVIAQRDLFAAMNLRRSQAAQLEAMQTNLAGALADVSRLSGAYGQLLSWNRVIGTLLRAPFGSLPPAPPTGVTPIHGMPRGTRLAVAAPTAAAAEDAGHQLARRLYTVGWLSGPWHDLLTAAAAEARDGALAAQPGAGTGSALDRFATSLAAGRVRPGGADTLWQRAFDLLADPQLAAGLTGTVAVGATGERTDAETFAAGLTSHRPGQAAAPFDAALFSPAAATAGAAAVALDTAAITRRGLGYTATVIQAGDGLPAYDFALFTPPVPDTPGGEDRTELIAVHARTDTPPNAQEVF